METPELNPEAPANPARGASPGEAGVPDAELIRPPDEWQGKPLWPHTRGTKMVLSQVCYPADIAIYRALAYVYIHIRRTEATAKEDIARHILPLAWGDINGFRAEIMAFHDGLSDEDEVAALGLYEAALLRESKTEVIPGPAPGSKGSILAAAKKKEASNRRKPSGKSGGRRKT